MSNVSKALCVHPVTLWCFLIVLQAKALAGESKSILQRKHYHTHKPKKL